ncbi:1-acyl-sn-glycerol-3-phosphate acyltransferase [Egicoccus sp. AB-alg2]|uniref:1-acyl-sn-glycerol-3-phosphate acyltransferase n=1 Tax=Egicoccus sp. AB-alg2 TaxID=3242693 RepID=UPI00359EF4A8
MLPPRWARRLVLAPAVPLLTLLVLTTLPLTLLVAAFASPVLPGRLRPLRILLFALVFLLAESVALVAMGALWLASGFGRRIGEDRWQAAHYAVMRHYLAVLVHTAQRTFKLDFAVDDEAAMPGADTFDAPAPVVVLSRHAGPGDSFLLVHGLLQRGLRPRIVLRADLQWAPALDVGLNRIPTHFVARGAPRGTGTAAVAVLAAGLRSGDALVLFPEGRNFTPARRLHSIARLEELDRHDEAEQARQMRHVLTPRPGGALAALTAAPAADVVFVAHTGLEDLSSVVDLWRGLPMDSQIEIEAWRVPAAEVPTDRAEAEEWLLTWWRRIDGWILARHGPAAIPDAVVTAVGGVEPGADAPQAPERDGLPSEEPSGP